MVKSNASVARCRVCGSRSLSSALPAVGGRSADDPASDPVAYIVCDAMGDDEACGVVQAEAAAPSSRPLEPVVPVGAAAARRTARAARAVSDAIGGRVLEIGADAFASGWWRTSASDDFGETVIHRADRADLQDAPGEAFDLIVSQQVLENADAPLSHARAVCKHLAPDGVWLIETAYAPAAVAQARADVFRRPMRTVYGLSSIEHLARRSRMKVVRGALIDEARTFRVALVRRSSTAWDDAAAQEALADLWDAEAALNLRRAAPFEALTERWEEIAVRTRTALQEAPAPRLLWADDAAGRAYARRLGVSDLIDEGADAPASLLVQTPTDERKALETLSDFIGTGGACVLSGLRTQVVGADAYPMALARALAESSAPGEIATLHAVLRAAGRPRLVRDAARSLGA